MNISQNKVVTIHYTLKDDAANVLDSSAGKEPLSYLHGHHNIIPGLEAALEGKTEGEKFDVRIEAKDAYGEYDKTLTQTVPRNMFGEHDPEVGMQFQAQTASGPQIVTVSAVEGENVTIDANHPLAGKPLNFEVSVEGIREASEDELDHGHAHGEGGHAH